MENFIRFEVVRRSLLAVSLALALAASARAADPASPGPVQVPAPAPTLSAEAAATNSVQLTNALAELEHQQLRSYLKLQEQLHSALLAIEQVKSESSQEARTNAEALTARLAQLERSLVEQREQQVNTLQASNRTLLVVAGGMVGLGLIALAFTAFQHSRGMNRLTEIATGLSQDRAMLSAALPAALGQGERLLLGAGNGNGSSNGPNKTLLATIDRLEHRIQELEHTAQPTLTVLPSGQVSGEASGRRSLNGHAPSPTTADHVSVLLGKGQVMLSLGQVESALACFDDAVTAEPDHADAHLRRGMALERLKRWDEALTSCDRAIALNPALTQAYLCKGGIFNRQERYTDALACYEQALRTESKA